MDGLQRAIRLIDGATSKKSFLGVYPERRLIDWDEIKSDVDQFNDSLSFLSKVEGKSRDVVEAHLSGPRAMGIINKLKVGDYPGRVGDETDKWLDRFWVNASFRGPIYNQSSDIQLAAKALDTYLHPQDDHTVVDDQDLDKLIPKWLNSLVLAMEKYSEDLGQLFEQATDEDIVYRGIPISNPWRVPYESLKGILDSLDWMLAFFKKRGVDKVLRKTMGRVLILPPVEIRSISPSGRAAGLYFSGQRVVVLSSDIPGVSSSGKMLKRWVNEVLLHEVGHLVHLSYLHPDARKEWDSGWAGVEKVKDIGRVKHKDRLRYWDLLHKVKGDLRKVKLRGLERLKFHAWLRNPNLNDPFVTAKQLRWSAWGKNSLLPYLQDPESYLLELNNPDLFLRSRMSTLGVTDYWRGQDYPILNSDVVDDLVEYKSLIKEEMAKLKVPTWYAETNVKEDFAETFVQFIAEPRKLSDVALYRMQRALHMSGLYGKRVMERVGASAKNRRRHG